MARAQISKVIAVKGGCNTCHGGNVGWTGKNALALAARHHDQTRHVTWAEQTMRTTYGASGPKTTRDEPRML